MSNLISQAYLIAEKADVTTPVDGAVVYSVSYMPDNGNKVKALEYVAHHRAMLLDDTSCGKELIELGLHGRVDEIGPEITKIWHIASQRYIAEAKGNIMAFVEGADERSTFCTVELNAIVANPNITHINGIDKDTFVANFEPCHY